ncbi:MAG: sporulation protein YqfD [Clostridia bacterium]|nr:sporulation protein YqfD [Clostridia bacterium]
MLISFVREKLRGGVKFRVSGGFPNAFLDACAARNITLTDVKTGADYVESKALYRDRKLLEAAAVDAGMTLERVRSSGLHAAAHRYRFRWGVPVGIVCFIAVLAVLSSMLWTIEIRGLTCIQKEDLLAVLEALDVKKGTFLNRISRRELQAVLENLDPRIVRVTVNLSGTGLYIDFLEREEPTEQKETKKLVNIYAAEDGMLLVANYFAGVGQFKVGDAVLKGDLLCTGELPMSDGSHRFVRAEAEVIAETRKTLHVFTAKSIKAELIEKATDHYGAAFFSLRLTPTEKKGQEGVVSAGERYLQTNSLVFPVGTLRDRETSFFTATLELTYPQAKLLSLTYLGEKLIHSDDFAHITKAGLNYLHEGGCTLEAEITAVKNIALPMEIDVTDRYNGLDP